MAKSEKVAVEVLLTIDLIWPRATIAKRTAMTE